MEVKSVSEIVLEIKDLLEGSFTNITLSGEVTNLSLSSSGHWYFTLSDNEAAISGALFKMDALRNPAIKKIKDGDKVIVSGDVNVYVKRGTFQVIAKKIVPFGVGDLKEQFEKLKKKLAQEGLFDLQNKKALPKFPKRIAIITAERGAALQDFLNIYKRRSLWMDILVVPALVQGEAAPASIRKALFNTLKYSMQAPEDKKIEVIVMARGGGSLEDLWAFNDEGLAYDIFNSDIPIISAVGHEVDFSISDFVADVRAETPSAAAEILTQHQTLLKDRMSNIKRRLLHYIDKKFNFYVHELRGKNPRNILNIILKNYSNLERRFLRLNVHGRISELTKIREHYLHLDDLLLRSNNILKNNLINFENRLNRIDGVINALNPKNVLIRGYSYIESSSNKLIGAATQFDKLEENTKLVVHFHDGHRTVKK